VLKNVIGKCHSLDTILDSSRFYQFVENVGLATWYQAMDYNVEAALATGLTR
jgi:hypothetical protein